MTKLQPSFEQDVAALLSSCVKRRWLFSAAARPAELPDIAAGIEVYAPRDITSVSAEMRAVIDCQLHRARLRAASQPDAATAVARVSAKAPALLILLSLSGSGYLREAAIKALPSVTGPFCLALLLQRVNDWVSPVRRAAVKKVEEFLSGDGPSQDKVDMILGCADLILDKERLGRLDEVSRAAVDRLTTYPGVLETMSGLLIGSRLDAAHRLLVYGLRTGIFDDQLESVALTGAHDRVRRTALRCLLEGKFNWKQDGEVASRQLPLKPDLDRLLESGLKDRSLEVQRIALRGVIRNKDSSLPRESVFRSFLSHPSFSMTEGAVFGLRSLGIDIVSELREELRSGASKVWIARVLAHYGEAADGDLLYAARSRCARDEVVDVLAASAQLKNGSAVDDLREIALRSDNLSEAQRATRALLKAQAGISFDDLRAALIGKRQFAERGLVRCVARLPAIQMTHLTVLMIRHAVDANYVGLWRTIGSKRNRGAFLPTEAEVEALAEAIGSDGRLKSKVYQLLGV